MAHHFEGTSNAVGAVFQFVEVGIDLETNLPVGEEHMAWSFTILFILPLRLIPFGGPAPVVVLSKAQGIVQIGLVAREFVSGLVACEIGGVVPESTTFGAVMALPVGLHFLNLLNREFGTFAFEDRGCSRQRLGESCDRSQCQDLNANESKKSLLFHKN